MANVKLLVLLEADQRVNMSSLAGELEGHGMTVQKQMMLTGTITGYAPPEAMDGLRAVRGIAELREDGIMQAIADDYEPGP